MIHDPFLSHLPAFIRHHHQSLDTDPWGAFSYSQILTRPMWIAKRIRKRNHESCIRSAIPFYRFTVRHFCGHRGIGGCPPNLAHLARLPRRGTDNWKLPV